MEPALTFFDLDGPAHSQWRMIRRHPLRPTDSDGQTAHWGQNPAFGAGQSNQVIGAERGSFPERRCLVPVLGLHFSKGARRLQATVRNCSHFYLLGIWTPESGDQPLSFSLITTDAGPDLAPYMKRQPTLIGNRQYISWLDFHFPEPMLLAQSPAHTFMVEDIEDI